MKFRKLSALLSLVLAGVLLTGCSREPAPVPEPTEAPGAMTLTQEKTVKREKFRDNPDYEAFLSAARQGSYVPGLAQHLIPQGITASETTGLTYVTAYGAAPTTPSVIAVLDTETGTLQGEYWLYLDEDTAFTGHVGGVAAAGNWLYLSAGRDEEEDYRIGRLDLRDLPEQGSHRVILEDFIKVQTLPSFLSAGNGYLFIGNFYHPKGKYPLPDTVAAPVETADGPQGSFIVACRLDDQGGLTMEGHYPRAELLLSAPDRIQGLCVWDGQILLSQSYGRKNDSAFLAYSADSLPVSEPLTLCGQQLPVYILDSRSHTGSLTAMPMAEGICPGPGGSICLLFESGAGKYDDGRDRTDTLWYLDLPS